ncbi:uncharacterized protein [Anabrus simplex]|uniref:uncharacterized protein n=1 Tax=Anabrus simplex TaxID=316456 RepID=UPI0035A2A5DE
MEEPHFIKCEPEWSAETKDILKLETGDYFPDGSLTSVKTETNPSCDSELNAEEETRDSLTECETLIPKEEIIKDEVISGRCPLDHDLHLPATSSSNGQKSAQDFTSNDYLRYSDELNYTCCHCEKVFKTTSHLKKHISDTHNRKGSYESDLSDLT